MPDQPASNRLRIGRYDEPNRIYLLTSNTHDRIPIFNDFKLGRLVVQQFRIAPESGIGDFPGLGSDARSFPLVDLPGKGLACRSDASGEV